VSKNSSSAKVVMPLPNKDFDPSEAAVIWQHIKSAGYQVVFSTVEGDVAMCDETMLTGEGLDFWGWLPILKKIRFFGLLLRANKDARSAYAQMIMDDNFQNPCRYDELNVTDYAGLILPGGHAPKMKPYLENKTLQKFVAQFFENKNDLGQHKPVAAICHGVVLAARSISGLTQQSVLYGKKTTALTWKLEKSAWDLSKYLIRFWDANYYRTYIELPNEPAGYRSVQQEVTRALQSEDDFRDVPKKNNYYFLKTVGLFRDKSNNSKAAWVVEDGNYLSARWPGDVHTLASKFIKKLNSQQLDSTK